MEPTPSVGGATTTTPFTVGSALSRAFKVFLTTVPRLSCAALIVLAPVVAIEWFIRRSHLWPDRSQEQELVSLGFQALKLGATFVVQGMVVIAVFQKLRGEPVDIVRSIRIGIARLPALIGIAFTVLFLGFVAGAAAFLLVLISKFLIVVVIAAAIPFLILLAGWQVASTAAVVEKLGVFRAMSRSSQLTKGYRGRILAAIFVVQIIAVLAAGLIERIGADSTPAGLSDDTPRALLLGALGLLITSMLSSVLPVVIYHDLRQAKEGIGLEQFASVFD